MTTLELGLSNLKYILNAPAARKMTLREYLEFLTALRAELTANIDATKDDLDAGEGEKKGAACLTAGGGAV